MNYIIDPALFYWLNVIDTLNRLILVLMILSITVAIASGIIFFVCWWDNDEYEGKHRTKQMLLISSVASLIFGILYIFCPNKETMIEMQVSRFATYENAEWTVETVKSAVDYIVQAIKSIK